MTLKSEKLIVILSSSTPTLTGIMASQGIELGRNGQNDPIAVLPPTYRTPVPNANIGFLSGGGKLSVYAFPIGPFFEVPLPKETPYYRPQFRKPRWPRSRPAL
jgi:hypothetical protein